MSLLEPEASAAALRLSAHADAATPLKADFDGLQEALVNLVLNAIQATPAGGWVRVSCYREEERIVFAVEDNGPGIDDHMRERIFEPFFTTKATGSGLGLALAHLGVPG